MLCSLKCFVKCGKLCCLCGVRFNEIRQCRYLSPLFYIAYVHPVGWCLVDLVDYIYLQSDVYQAQLIVTASLLSRNCSFDLRYSQRLSPSGLTLAGQHTDNLFVVVDDLSTKSH